MAARVRRSRCNNADARCSVRDRSRTGEPARSSGSSACRRRTPCATIRDALRSLAPLEGPKSVILISEGLVLEGLGGEVDDIAAVAADVRARLDVMLLDVPGVDVVEKRSARRRRARTASCRCAASSRSRAVRAARCIASITAAIRRSLRVLRSIAGYYLLAVEARPHRSRWPAPSHQREDGAARRDVVLAARLSGADLAGRDLAEPMP